MKAQEIIENVKVNFGRMLSIQLLYEWEGEGLLGEVVKRHPSKKGSIKDYNSKNLQRIYLLTYFAGIGWTRSRLKELIISKDNQTIHTAKSAISNMKNYGMQKLVELAEVDFII